MTSNNPGSTTRRPVRQGNWFWTRAHYLLRMLGVVGLLAVAVALVFARGIPGFYTTRNVAWDRLSAVLLQGQVPADLPEQISVYGLLGGGAVVLLALFVELLLMFSFVAARRSLMGFNAAFQVALAALLLIGVNVFAFLHPLREDCTRTQQFTLPAAIEKDLKKLKGETTIVVYQRHKSSGSLNDKPDRYDFAAERKVVEMVKDLVAQFHEVGPQFQVVVLDVEEEGFEEKLKKLTDDKDNPKPELRKTIDAAPGNSIFFYRDHRVQQLGFEEFYLLDKLASKEGRGNLVLLAQGEGGSGRGVETFARRIFNIDERRPRIGVLAIHELLTTQGGDDTISMQGLRRALEARGFDVRDIVLKKGWRTGSLEPAADTHEEGRLETLEAEIDALEADIKELQDGIKEIKGLADDWSLKPGEDEVTKLEYLSRKYPLPDGRRIRFTAEFRTRQVEALKKAITQLEEELEESRNDLNESQKERQHLDLESIAENRRMSDVNGKLSRVLSDCDVLLIPRLTRGSNFGISPALHNLYADQAAELKRFLRSGKPILACLGPVNTFGPPRFPPDTEDHLEPLLAELGIRLNKQIVLFPADARAFAQRRESFAASGGDKIPLLDFETPTSVGKARWLLSESAGMAKQNPLRESLRVTARSVGHDFDLRLRFPRPVFYDATPTWAGPAEAAVDVGLLASSHSVGPLAAVAVPSWRRRIEAAGGKGNADTAGSAGLFTIGAGQGPLGQAYDATFLLTGMGWNDDRTGSLDEDPPLRFRPPKPDDPLNGTLDEKRRGQFPVGVALETPLPAAWTSDEPKRVRLAVIGQADLFAGKELKPANERLLLQTMNWLLHREDYLPTAQHPWSYPRIDMTETQQDLWLCLGRFGLPVVFAFLGFVVLLTRRLR